MNISSSGDIIGSGKPAKLWNLARTVLCSSAQLRLQLEPVVQQLKLDHLAVAEGPGGGEALREVHTRDVVPLESAGGEGDD